jgi:hypothetical protein
VNTDLAAIVRIKRMAEAAASPAADGRRPTTVEAVEMAAAYERLQRQARDLTQRAGWSVDEFDAEMPELSDEPSVAPSRSGTGLHPDLRRGLRAKVLLGQLSAWAAGYQEVFELDARLDAEARAKVEQSRRGPTGFTG